MPPDNAFSDHMHSYQERLWPSIGVFGFALLMTSSTGVAAAHFYGFNFGLTLGIALSIVAVIGLLVTAPVIAIDASGLKVGVALLPLNFVGNCQALTQEQTRLQLGSMGRADTFRLVKGWIKTSVFLENLDSEDPYKTWHFSSREPQLCIATLNFLTGRHHDQ